MVLTGVVLPLHPALFYVGKQLDTLAAAGRAGSIRSTLVHPAKHQSETFRRRNPTGFTRLAARAVAPDSRRINVFNPGIAGHRPGTPPKKQRESRAMDGRH